MDWACNTYTKKSTYEVSRGRAEGERPFRDLYIGSRIILKWFLEREREN
jgi:hypothetical protein